MVFYVAGLIPRLGVKTGDMHAVNATGTKNIVEACKQASVRRLLYTSTTDVVMSKDPNQVLDNVDETTPLPSNPIDAYTGSKIQAEKVVLDANGCGSLVTCCLRPSVIAAVDSIMCRPLLMTEAGYIDGGMKKMTIVPIGACTS